MAFDMHLKLGDIKGEDSILKDQIKVLAWSWGLTQSGSTHSGSGSGAGKVSVQDISLTKPVDKSTPTIMLYCCNGKHIDDAVLTIRKAGGDKPVDYLKIELTKIIITSVSEGGSGGEDELTENVTLNFGTFKITYTPQGGKGAGEGAIPTGWDIAANVKL